LLYIFHPRVPKDQTTCLTVNTCTTIASCQPYLHQLILPLHLCLPSLSHNRSPLLPLALTHKPPQPLALTYITMSLVAQLTPDKFLAQSTCYLDKEDKYDWENLPKFNATPPDWDAFKLSLGCVQVLGNPLYHWLIWKPFLRRSQRRRYIPSMTMPSSTKNSGG